MKTVLAFMVVIVLTTITQGQQVDPISELVRANDIFLKVAVQLNNLASSHSADTLSVSSTLPSSIQ